MSNDYPETDELPEPPKVRPSTFIEREYHKALAVLDAQAQEIATLRAERDRLVQSLRDKGYSETYISLIIIGRTIRA